MSRSIAAEGTDDFQLGAVVDDDVVSQQISECDMVPAVQLEFPALQAVQELPQRIRFFVETGLFICHFGTGLSAV